MSDRPLADRLEVAAPSLAALAARLATRLPEGLRQRVLTDAFERAAAAFNRGDFEAIFTHFADDAHYVPPPGLSAEAITGRAAVLSFWRSVSRRFTSSTIENLSIDELTTRHFIRTARLTHRADDEVLSYVIRQTTDLRGGRVVSQINEEVTREQPMSPDGRDPLKAVGLEE